jgi:hypothetical protein
MPYDIQHTECLICLTYRGQVTRAELRDSAAAVAELEARLPVRPDQLTDLTGIESRETDFENLQPVAASLKSRAGNAFRIAYIAPTPLSFGMARMFQRLAESERIEIPVFNSRAATEAWLGIGHGTLQAGS